MDAGCRSFDETYERCAKAASAMLVQSERRVSLAQGLLVLNRDSQARHNEREGEQRLGDGVSMQGLDWSLASSWRVTVEFTHDLAIEKI